MGTFSCFKIVYNKLTITMLLKAWVDVDKSDVMSVFIDNFISLCMARFFHELSGLLVYSLCASEVSVCPEVE